MAEDNTFDVVVIGSGPGGYVAAIRASQLGLKTACVERAELGGVCLNWGCIPTKALLHNAKLYSELSHGKTWGFSIDGEITVDWPKVIKRSRQVSKRLNRGVAGLFKKYGVTAIEGEATIERPGRVAVGDRMLEAKHIIVATGARPRALPGLAFDGETVMSSKEAMVVDPMPERLLVIGAGAIGCEFAYFFNAFGSKVTLVEMAPGLLPVEDDEVSDALQRSFAKQGITIHTETIAKDVTVSKDGVRATLAPTGDGESTPIEADRVLVAIGVVGNVEGLGLEACGVTLERGCIVIDDEMRTSCPGIYAIGDVTGPPALAHKASAEAIHCVERIAGHVGKPVDYGNIPGCTYCEPQVASVGLTEQACKAQGLPTKIGKFPYAASGKALAIEEKEGFVKMIFHAETGELLGSHIIGYNATELIAEPTLARSLEATEAEILGTIHAHPTLAEALHEAVAAAYGEGVNY